jgi:phosphatidylserine/phosphatidylglycerophosphate/cardiolipin synthase-like enzyme
MALNDEATLMVSDRTLGQQMEQVFMEDLGYAREITLDAFRRRSWLQRIAERGANFFTRLL